MPDIMLRFGVLCTENRSRIIHTDLDLSIWASYIICLGPRGRKKLAQMAINLAEWRIINYVLEKMAKYKYNKYNF